MNPELESLFDAARKLSTSVARKTFLDAACADRPELRQEIQALLAAQDDADNLFERGAAGLRMASGSQAQTVSAVPSFSEEKPGDRIGRYKLREKIGEGGCGVVYVAEQEEPVRRKVALKVIKLGMDTKSVIARFEAERQALAMMDHPNIAKVFDAGTTEMGRPYFVMELVRGVRITDYCDENKLSTRERLELFIQVCQAVQHAHQKGIIHRDLKPSNILVTINDGVGVPKVIDFGIAKAVEGRLTEHTVYTELHQFIGTPAYMSPEQAVMTSLDIDTRSDVYSLGVLLYELLTGKTPFDARELLKAGLDEMRRTILEKEPVRPSTRLNALQRDELTTTAKQRQTDVPKLLHQLRGDLDWIVMKCLEKDRNRRYETANGLAADIKRHLSNEPILARPPSRLYEFQKTVRRHRVAFAATAAVLLTLMGGVAVSSWQAVKAKRESENAQAAKDFLIENLLGATDGEAPDADALTFEATQALARKVAGRMEGKFTNQPLAEADIRMALGKVFLQAQDFTQTVFQAQRALEIRRMLLPPGNTNIVSAVQRLAAGKFNLGQRKEALDLLTNAIAMARAGGPPASATLSWALNTYGAFLTMEGRGAEALPYLNESLALARRIYDPKSIDIKTCIVRIIEATRQTGDSARADVLVRELLAQSLADHGPDHPFTVGMQFGLGRSLVEQQRWQEALPLLERVWTFRRAQMGLNNFSTLAAQLHLGQAYEQKGDIPAAAKLYADLHPRYVKYLPYWSANHGCTEVARFFVRHRHYEEARMAFGALRESYDAKPPEFPVDFDRWVEAAAPTKGWAAVTKVYRAYPGRFERDATYQRNMASAFLYGDDRDGYRQTVTNALARALTATNIDEQRRFADIIGFGRSEFSSDEINLCEKLLSLAGTNTAWHRPMAALLLRLGRFEGAIQRLELALQKKPSTIEQARLLMLKAICLSQSDEPGKARTAFDEAEALMKDQLLARLPKEEGFIDHDERTFLIHRREAQALLAGKRPD